MKTKTEQIPLLNYKTSLYGFIFQINSKQSYMCLSIQLGITECLTFKKDKLLTINHDRSFLPREENIGRQL